MTTLSTTREAAPKRNAKRCEYKCDICMATYASKRSLNNHQKSCIALKLHCDICNRSVNSKMAMIVHKKLHAWEKSIAEKEQFSPVYECSVCDVQTRSPRYLVLHYMEDHPNYDRLGTNKLSKQKSTRRLLFDVNQNEIVKHPDVLANKVKCPLCGFLYDENRIKGHLMTAHRFHKSLFCSHCAAIILDDMKAHLLEHTAEGNIRTCEMCEIMFISAEDLATHRRLHTSQGPYSCSVCQKEYQSKTAANAHFYSHLKIEVLRESKKDENVVPQNPATVQTVNKPFCLPSQSHCLIEMEDTNDFINILD